MVVPNADIGWPSPFTDDGRTATYRQTNRNRLSGWLTVRASTCLADFGSAFEVRITAGSIRPKFSICHPSAFIDKPGGIGNINGNSHGELIYYSRPPTDDDRSKYIARSKFWPEDEFIIGNGPALRFRFYADLTTGNIRVDAIYDAAPQYLMMLYMQPELLASATPVVFLQPGDSVEIRGLDDDDDRIVDSPLLQSATPVSSLDRRLGLPTEPIRPPFRLVDELYRLAGAALTSVFAWFDY